MSRRVYLETTVLSYLVARPSRDVAVNAQLPAVPVSDAVRDLARSLIDGGVLPAKALADALHVAAAAVNRVEYLVTWNLKHLAGAVTRRRLENALRDRGYDPPTICTPEELISDPEEP